MPERQLLHLTNTAHQTFFLLDMQPTPNKRQQQAKVLRIARLVHRQTGALLFVCFLFISVTGLLLGWKKNSNDWLLASTAKGSTTELATWLPIDSLQQRAVFHLSEAVSSELSPAIDRIDVRPDKGVVKFTFQDHYYGLQLDGATGQLLRVEKRRADFIEQLHDGSVIDRFFLGGGSVFKLLYTSITGVALLLFTITGFWLWYGPKRMRAGK